MSNSPEYEFVDPVIFIYPNGKTQIKESGLGLMYKGCKLDGKRPTLILYPEGLLSEAEIENFRFILTPYKGQAVSYKPTGATYYASRF